MLEQGLISFYISKVQTIGVKALAGEDYVKPIEKVLDEAFTHLGGVKTSDPLKNLKAMACQLTLLAEHTHASQPQYRATVDYASGLVRKHLAFLEASVVA